MMQMCGCRAHKVGGRQIQPMVVFHDNKDLQRCLLHLFVSQENQKLCSDAFPAQLYKSAIVAQMWIKTLKV